MYKDVADHTFVFASLGSQHVTLPLLYLEIRSYFLVITSDKFINIAYFLR